MGDVFLQRGLLAQLLLLAWAALVLYLGLRVVRYRRKCRRAVEHNAPIPIPSRSTARFRGAAPLCYALIALGIGISLFISISDSHTTFEGGSTLTTGDSVFGQTAEYRRFSEKDGDLWVESYDCRTSWLAGIICDDLRAIEGDQGRLDRYFHLHDPAALTQAELGYDQAWTYHWDEGNGLIFRQGDRVIHIEAEKLNLTDNNTVSSLLGELDRSACALLESVIS